MAIDKMRILKRKRAAILRIAEQHGAYNIRVFGSVVRGEAGPTSDIDFLVDVKPVHSSWFPSGLVADLQQLLDSDVDVLTENALHWYIRDRVLKEAVQL